ncbi:MAG: hypothetical protein ACT4P5_02395 [Armatimonadota bacterium]
MNRKRAVLIACVTFVFSIALSGSKVHSQQHDLNKLLVGKWRQVVGPYVTETVNTENHKFVSVTIQRGTPYRFYVEGTWEIRYGNQLWSRAVRWVPDSVRMPEWESTWIQVINVNHFKNKLGDVYRVQ